MMSLIGLSRIIGPMYLVFGFSILLYVKSWQKILKSWQENHLSLFCDMFVSLVFGLVIINIYNMWRWNVWTLVTITGWALIIKSAAYFLLPGSVIKSILKFKSQPWVLYTGAVICLAVGAVLSYHSISGY